ncbi:MAG: glycosyltransferase [Arcanobacterium sp.]|nr:glycosyltransferase [Arcanobacterium sp.]MDY6143091.1 glycosyltransferase [Arcanobacterium sp.]
MNMDILEEIYLPPVYGRRPSSKVKVAGILDTFSNAAFSDAFDYFPIARDDFELFFDEVQPALVFVESAWHGNDDEWVYQLAGPAGPKKAFQRLVAAAQQRNIPVVFWNKEDPPHFEQFIDAAGLCDHIFTTEQALIPTYHERTGIDSVQLLRFAAAPTIHRPDQVDHYRRGEVCFAGQYFRHKYPERREQMDVLFSASKDYDFTIYSRVFGGDENYQFPQEYVPYVRGSLPYDEMVKEYKRHRIFLNVNSVPQSNSMCARRVFELAASKTLVLSMPTKAIISIFGTDQIPLVNDVEEARAAISRYLADADLYLSTTQRAWRTVLLDHTYKHRAFQILDAANIEHASVYRPINITISNSHDLPVAHVTHNLDSIVRTIRKLATHQLVGSVNIADRHLSRSPLLLDLPGLNSIRDQESPVTTLDVSCTYGENYLLDLVLLKYQFEEADIVTKAVTKPASRISHSCYWGSRDDIIEGGFIASNQRSLESVRTRVGELQVFVGDDFNFMPTGAQSDSVFREI